EARLRSARCGAPARNDAGRRRCSMKPTFKEASYKDVFDDDPTPDTPAALSFIARYTAPIKAPTICLTSIIPDGSTTTATSDASDMDGQRKWIDARQGQQNIYFAVNVVTGRPTSKPGKND